MPVKIDLITGFLGAGKTTFLLRYARYLLAQGQKLGILVYDHGAMNVDLPLLNGLRGENCELETLAGGCGPDCHRRRFRTRLIAMAMCGYDRVVIEPSGVFDMDEFFDTLQEAPLDRQYELGSVIAVVDAKTDGDFSPEEDFFLASQTACAGGGHRPHGPSYAFRPTGHRRPADRGGRAADQKLGCPDAPGFCRPDELRVPYPGLCQDHRRRRDGLPVPVLPGPPPGGQRPA